MPIMPETNIAIPKISFFMGPPKLNATLFAVELVDAPICSSTVKRHDYQIRQDALRDEVHFVRHLAVLQCISAQQTNACECNGQQPYDESFSLGQCTRKAKPDKSVANQQDNCFAAGERE